MNAAVDGHMSIREINRCGLPKVAQCHFGVAQSSSDETVHGAAQRTAVAAARFVVLEVCFRRLTNKLVRQQPEKRDDISLFYHLGSLGPLPPKHYVHRYGAARTVQYHSEDIIPVRAKVRYTTLIELPATEKIMEAATGDKDFWIVDVVGNFCFVHPAKAGISSNLNLITDKGNIYSFTLQDVSISSGEPDLKVIVQPADRSAIVTSGGNPQFVSAAQLAQSQEQLAKLQSHVTQAIDEYKSTYPMKLKFDYKFKANAAPFDIQSIYHDDQFTYIRTNAPEKFSVYEIRDGKPNLITYDLREGTYIIPKVMDNGYVELGKKRMNFSRSSKG
jgi:type IV secretory pathway VirB9-like protein